MENKKVEVLNCPKDSYVALEHIDKVYDNGVQAVFDFNLDIKKHEFIVFVGPSGCGKSTTLRMIAGLEDITRGNLFIDGEYVNDVTPKDRNIAMVFQSYALYPHMTVFDNMAFSLKINKVPVKVLSDESAAKLNEAEKKLNEVYKEYYKINTKHQEYLNLKNEEENLTRDVETIKDEKKKAKFQKKLDAVKSKLNKFIGIDQDYNDISQKIDVEDKAVKEIKEHVTYKMHIDEKAIANLKKQLETAKQKDKANDVLDLEKKINYFEKNEVPVTKMEHVSKGEINRRVHEAAQILQIENYLDRKPKALSGGQRQRVALGRAIVRNAKVFLMDEPLSNLDAKLRVQMRSEIVRLHNQLNATTIYVTHDQTEAMTMATRIVIMKLGHIQQIGTPIEIYNHPANLFVAGFIGSPAMNFFNVKFNKGIIKFETGEEIKVPNEIIKDKKIPEDVIIGIRPEDIHPGDGEHAKEFPGSILSIKVKVAELLGSEYFVHSTFANKELVCKMEANKTISVDEDIKICINLRKVHFFDPKTEKSI